MKTLYTMRSAFSTFPLLAVLTGCNDGAFARPSRHAKAESAPASVQSRDTTIRTRRLWSGSEYEAVPSPDGRSLLVGMADGNVGILDVGTAQIRKVTTDGDMKKTAYYAGAFSPDGKQVAFIFENWDKDSVAIIVANADGTQRRALINAAAPSWAWVQDWSPDGEWLLINHSGNLSLSMQMISTRDGRKRQLKSFDWRVPINPTFSADGRFVTYSFQTSERDVNLDLYSIDLQSGREQQLTRTSESEIAVGMDARQRIYYTTFAQGSGRIWSALRSNTGLGKPTLTRSDLVGLYAATFRGGRIYYATKQTDSRLNVASIDSRTGAMSSPVVIQRFEDAPAEALVWSPDGEHLAVFQRRHYGGRVASQSVAVQSVNTAERREFSLGPIGYVGAPMIWDQSGIRIPARQNNRNDWHLLNFATGNTRVIEAEEFMRIGAAIYPQNRADGGRTLFAIKRADASKGDTLHRIVARDWQSGTERVIHSSRHLLRGLTRSPDGQSLAYVSGGEHAAALEIVPVTGGTPRTIWKVEEPEWIGAAIGTPLPWSSSGHLFVTKITSGSAATVEIWRVLADGSGAERVYVADRGINLGNLHMSPNRQRIAFTTSLPNVTQAGTEYTPKFEYWVLEGLPTKSARLQLRPAGKNGGPIFLS